MVDLIPVKFSVFSNTPFIATASVAVVESIFLVYLRLRSYNYTSLLVVGSLYFDLKAMTSVENNSVHILLNVCNIENTFIHLGRNICIETDSIHLRSFTQMNIATVRGISSVNATDRIRNAVVDVSFRF